MQAGMQREPGTSEPRRGVLRVFVNGTITAIGAALAGVVGRFAVAPRAIVEEQWLRAVPLGDLDPGKPHPVIVAMPREDGWSRTRANEIVFLVWDGLTGVRAMSATCTHLGCRVRWDDGAKKFTCPCHGGEYDANGRVTSGPPPRPLTAVEARINDAGDVEVRL